MRASWTSEQRTNYDTCASQAGRGRSISKNALAAAPTKSDQLSGATIQYFSNRWLLTRRTNRVVHHSKIWLLMSEMGHKRKSSLRAFDVRFAPVRGHQSGHALTSALCHVWTAPSWQVLSSRLQAWSVQPCVRPTCAVHMTAGHNALRGSGPGHNLAFDNALAQVGCPDRRIDRLRITCCSPSQPSHHAGCPARSCYAASATGCL